MGTELGARVAQRWVPRWCRRRPWRTDGFEGLLLTALMGASAARRRATRSSHSSGVRRASAGVPTASADQNVTTVLRVRQSAASELVRVRVHSLCYS